MNLKVLTATFLVLSTTPALAMKVVQETVNGLTYSRIVYDPSPMGNTSGGGGGGSTSGGSSKFTSLDTGSFNGGIGGGGSTSGGTTTGGNSGGSSEVVTLDSGSFNGGVGGGSATGGNSGGGGGGFDLPVVSPAPNNQSSQALVGQITALEAREKSLELQLKLWDRRIMQAQASNQPDTVAKYQEQRDRIKSNLSSLQNSLRSAKIQLTIARAREAAEQARAIAEARRVEIERLRQQNSLIANTRARLAMQQSIRSQQERNELEQQRTGSLGEDNVKRLPANLPAIPVRGGGGGSTGVSGDPNQEIVNAGARAL